MSQPRSFPRTSLGVLIMLAGLAAGLACGDIVNGPGGQQPRAVRGLSLGTAIGTLSPGDTVRLPLVALDQRGGAFDALPTGVTVVWESEDERIATVSSSGLVTAIGPGTTRITARAANIAALPPVSTVVTVRSRARLIIIGPSTPVGTVGQPLADPIAFRIEDGNGAGMSGVVLRFTVVGPQGDSTISDVTSDENGIAALPLTLGTRAGSYTVHARLRDVADVAVTLVAIARAGVAGRVEIVTGGTQTGTVGERLAQPVVVRVTDAFGNPIADSTVTFLPEGGSGSLSPGTIRTDANGLASAVWTLGTVAGAQRGVATIGTLAAAPFQATALAGPVASVITEPSALTFATLGRASRVGAVLRDRFGNLAAAQAVTWSTTAGSVATVDGSGEVRAQGPGSALIIATANGVADTTVVTVTQYIAAVVASASSMTLRAGETAQLSAVATDSGGAVVASPGLAWRSENESVVRVDAAGLVTAVAPGSARIIVAAGSAADTVEFTVEPVAPTYTVQVIPDSVNLEIGRDVWLQVRVRDGSGQDIRNVPLSWTSTDPSVATVVRNPEIWENATVDAIREGRALIIVTVEGVSDTAVVIVRRIVRSVVAEPSEVTLLPAETAQLSARAFDRVGGQIDTARFEWRSQDEAVARVDASGLVTAVGPGATGIIVTSGSAADTVRVTVPGSGSARVVIEPDSLRLAMGDSEWIRIRVYDASGNEETNADLTWHSTNTAVATVIRNPEIWDAATVEALGEGTALIIATVGSAADTMEVTVERTTETVAILPERVTLAPGQAAQLTAVARDGTGGEIENATFTWRSSDERIATVSQAGVLTGISEGFATITAESDGVTGSASSATIATCGPTRIAPFGVAQSLGPPECVLRLNSGTNQGSGGAWSTDKPRIANGFDVTFQFRITEPGNGGADGFVFIIQDFSANYVGGGGGGIGYHGLPRSIAIEFDTWPNGPGEANDPDDNHISVHTNGVRENNVDESFSIGRIDASAMPFLLDDGAVHTVRVRYVPGSMEIYLDGAATPALTVAVDLRNIEGASILDAEGRAWMGFTAATGFAYETHDILSWSIETMP